MKFGAYCITAQPLTICAIDQRQHPVGVLRQLLVVGDDHDGRAFALANCFERLQHNRARLGIEVAGRLVGEQQRRIVGERPRNGDALLLSAGKLGRAVLHAVAQAEQVEQFFRAPLRVAHGFACELHRQQDVFQRRQRRDQVEELEDEADLLVANFGELVFAHARDVDAVDLDFAMRRAVQPADQTEQGAFAAAGRSDDADDFPRVNVHIHSAQRVDDCFAERQVFRQTARADDEFCTIVMIVICHQQLLFFRCGILRSMIAEVAASLKHTRSCIPIFVAGRSIEHPCSPVQ